MHTFSATDAWIAVSMKPSYNANYIGDDLKEIGFKVVLYSPYHSEPLSVQHMDSKVC